LPFALVAGRGPRLLRRRAASLLVASAAVVLLFLVARGFLGDNVDTLLAEKHEALRDLLTANSWRVLLGQPLPFLKDYMPDMAAFFQWWNPLLLVAGVATLYVLRARTLVWMVVASIAAYLLIIRIPLLAITYAYATYFEILYTPVRNVMFFVHMLAGASLYLVAARLARRGYVTSCIAALLISIVIVACSAPQARGSPAIPTRCSCPCRLDTLPHSSRLESRRRSKRASGSIVPPPDVDLHLQHC
jgi:hypothetical protein